jgi:hypothetical protein
VPVQPAGHGTQFPFPFPFLFPSYSSSKLSSRSSPFGALLWCASFMPFLPVTLRCRRRCSRPARSSTTPSLKRMQSFFCLLLDWNSSRSISSLCQALCSNRLLNDSFSGVALSEFRISAQLRAGGAPLWQLASGHSSLPLCRSRQCHRSSEGRNN